MQRKNHILNSYRNGIAMIMAIMVIVIISTILMLALRLTTQTTKGSTNLYLAEQANLYARSAGEYARLKIGLENNTTYCYPGEVLIENDIYLITINVSYNFDVTTAVNYPTCPTYSSTALVQTENYGTALVDISIEINDATITSEPIRIFKRKLIEL